MSQHYGGPAFPVWELNGQGKPEMTHFGMDLRDYFAAKAMQARLTGTNLLPGYADDGTVTRLAVQSYIVADAMLAAREAR